MGKLDGRVAVVTGATSGMALASAKLFVEEGAHVFITGRRRAQLDAAVTTIGRNVTGVQGDVASLEDLDRLYETVKKKHGHIDVLFASAGTNDFGKPIGTVTPDGFDAIFDVNVRGTFFTVQKALPLFRDGASVILNGSIAAVKGIPGASVYSATKAAIRSFARTWTADLKDRRIRVNVIHPGSIGDTGSFAGATDELKRYFIDMIPAGRLGESREIAAAALFLASSDASFVSGIELFVDGGTAQI